ncbi:MAG TPA: P-II family nitrogen regulator [Coleofasciculaceae cyanobacterium]|jgi:nitrogen regulatory protein P-II 1
MKRIEAIIKEENLDAVKAALEAAGFIGLTVFNCRGRGTGGGINLEWRAGTYKVDLLHKIMLMMIVKDHETTTVTDIILEVCKVDATSGAGKIFISPVEEVIRIRTNERNEDAL